MRLQYDAVKPSPAVTQSLSNKVQGGQFPLPGETNNQYASYYMLLRQVKYSAASASSRQ